MVDLARTEWHGRNGTALAELRQPGKGSLLGTVGRSLGGTFHKGTLALRNF